MRFDAYLMVDWSASSTPKRGRDSIWWALAAWTKRGLRLERAENPPTRSEALQSIAARLAQAVADGASVLVGFDFALGYPEGTAAALGLEGEPWRALWNEWSRLVTDTPDNGNNRFEVASTLNARISGGAGPFWGHPRGYASANLGATRSFAYPVRGLAEKRLADARTPRAQPVWKLCGIGSVGSQTLLGIPRLRQLLEDSRLAEHISVWPFETGFALPSRSSPRGRLILAEVYPSLLTVPSIEGFVKDQLQVEALARHFAALDADGRLAELFNPLLKLEPARLAAILEEEGWILGITRAGS
ncbi:cobalamin biosynthesis protein CbiG [Vitiosangium sp. GDMCC 1.1324]|uniref:cobalamin biosynthesis protein CbiG n=1 Tax=Vitiosangium sp. (strain GDMCC 1.1324) TaxID=2138576 RepID=UPI000D388DFE|nr:cobalamin biosynthesis protein CbiG [Vitiosangium sp. GDMCC 1.1324]PTL83336.1 cobalamin biosynthesis protein CbiG [Vitiosangium sp. GDMCC 1.1324]